MPPQVDKALVNVGSMFLETVTGRVSTEVDPRIAFDAGATNRMLCKAGRCCPPMLLFCLLDCPWP